MKNSILIGILSLIHSLGLLFAQNTLPPGQDPINNTALIEMWAESNEVANTLTVRFLYPTGGNPFLPENPDNLTFLYRRPYSSDSTAPWELVASLPPGTTSWTDGELDAGVAYEYNAVYFEVGSQPTLRTIRYGFTGGGIGVEQPAWRGVIIVVLAENIVSENLEAITTLYHDLIGDGWTVRTIMAPYFNEITFTGNDTRGIWGYRYPQRLRNQIRQIYTEDPDNTHLLYFLGHTPINLTGTSLGPPDGHGNRTIYPADHYYADMHGVWTDNAQNTRTTAYSIFTARNAPNFPNDGIWDQNSITTPLAMGFGRVDPWDGANATWYTPDLTESERIARYLNKAHRFKNFLPYGPTGNEQLAGRKAQMRFTQGGQTGASEYAATFISMVGPDNMDNWIALPNLPTPIAPITDEDVQYTVNNGPYLFYGQGSRVPPNGGNEGFSLAVNWSSMQSYFGDWHVVNSMRRHIMADNMALTWIHTGRFQLEEFNHGIGLGEPIGLTMKVSTNFPNASTYSHSQIATNFPQNLASGYSNRLAAKPFVNILHGDPSLRMFPVPPVQNLVVSMVGNGAELTWEEPAETAELHSYRVLRALDIMGPYQLIADNLDSTSFIDLDKPAGPVTYMVQAMHLVQTGAGSILNNAQGRFASLGIEVPTVIIPPLRAGEEYEFQLETLNADSPVQWSVINGHLPAGTSLSTDGLLSGRPIIPGHYPIQLQVRADNGQQIRRYYSLYVDAEFTEILHLDLNNENGFGLTDRVFVNRPLNTQGNPQFTADGGMSFNGQNDAIIVNYLGSLTGTFNGWGDYLDMPFRRPSFSVFFRVPPESNGGIILSRSQNVNTVFADNQNMYTIRLLPDGRVQGWTRNFPPLTSVGNLKDNQWHHVVLTYDPANSNGSVMYVNGELVGSQGVGNKTINERLVIGARWDGPGETGLTDHFEGVLSEVKVYASPISAGEAKALYERFKRTREDINSAPPAVTGVSPRIVPIRNGGEHISTLQVSSSSHAPLDFWLVPSNTNAFTSYYVTYTAGGYRIHLTPASNYSGNTSVTLWIEDGWPGNLTSINIPVSVVVGQNYNQWSTTINWGGANATPYGDADNDGINNQSEFFFGTSPLIPNELAEPPLRVRKITSAGGDHLAVSFSRRKGITGLRHLIQSSTDLQNWNDEATLFETILTGQSNNDVDTVEVIIPAEAEHKFIRLKLIHD